MCRCKKAASQWSLQISFSHSFYFLSCVHTKLPLARICSSLLWECQCNLQDFSSSKWEIHHNLAWFQYSNCYWGKWHFLWLKLYDFVLCDFVTFSQIPTIQQHPPINPSICPHIGDYRELLAKKWCRLYLLLLDTLISCLTHISVGGEILDCIHSLPGLYLQGGPKSLYRDCVNKEALC